MGLFDWLSLSENSRWVDDVVGAGGSDGSSTSFLSDEPGDAAASALWCFQKHSHVCRLESDRWTICWSFILSGGRELRDCRCVMGDVTVLRRRNRALQYSHHALTATTSSPQ